MEFFRNAVYRLRIPVNAVLLIWALLGAGLIEHDTFILQFLGVLILAFPLSATSMLETRQPRRPARLSAAQAIAQLVVWAAMAAYGLTRVALGYPGAEASLLTRWFGDDLLALSRAVAGGSFLVGLTAWVVLLVLLLVGLRAFGPRTRTAI